MNKEETIKSIAQRIKDEHRKHKDLDWAEIAASKIYGAYFEKPTTEFENFQKGGLKPETWKEDLRKAYKERLEQIDKYHQKELGKYKQKMDWFLEGEELINEHV